VVRTAEGGTNGPPDGGGRWLAGSFEALGRAAPAGAETFPSSDSDDEDRMMGLTPAWAGVDLLHSICGGVRRITHILAT